MPWHSFLTDLIRAMAFRAARWLSGLIRRYRRPAAPPPRPRSAAAPAPAAAAPPRARAPRPPVARASCDAANAGEYGTTAVVAARAAATFLAPPHAMPPRLALIRSDPTPGRAPSSLGAAAPPTLPRPFAIDPTRPGSPP